MLIASLPNDLGLGKRIAEALKADHVSAYSKVFPDGELYVRFGGVNTKDDEVFITQTLYPKQNDRIVELLLGIDALRNLGFKNINLIIPYFAYARQDRVFLKGEAVSIRVLMTVLHNMNVKKIITIDIHSVRAASYFKGKLYNVIPSKLFAKRVKELGYGEGSIVVAPDLGAKARAESLSKELNTDFMVIKKFRDRVTGEVRHELPEHLNIEGANAIIVDDIISTGGTIANIANFLKEKGVKRVIVAVSHGLFVNNALERLRKSGIEKIILIHTVPKINDPLLEYLDPTPLICDVLRGLR